jgi:DinB superfamily
MKKEILRELEGATKDLFQFISSFTQEEINKVPFEGSWTAGQVAEHLFRSDSSILAALYGTAKPAERQPDLHQEELKAVFLNFDIKQSGPEEIRPTGAWHEKEALLHSLEGTRARIFEAVSILDLSVLCIHPALGELTRMEFIYFVIYHTQRHIHQLKNISNP